MSATRAHAHVYDTHPNLDWQTHLACTKCGFAMPKRMARGAYDNGARFTDAGAVLLTDEQRANRARRAALEVAP